MTYRYSDFQFDGTLDAVRSSIEDVLGYRLSERESSYWGGTYYLFEDIASDFRLKLHCNVDNRGGWINAEFKGSHVLCSISGPVEMVGTFVAAMVGAGGQLLTSRTKEIDIDDRD